MKVKLTEGQMFGTIYNMVNNILREGAFRGNSLADMYQDVDDEFTSTQHYAWQACVALELVLKGGYIKEGSQEYQTIMDTYNLLKGLVDNLTIRNSTPNGI